MTRWYDIERQRSYEALNILVASGKIDPYDTVRELMLLRPTISWEDAVRHFSAWLVRVEREERGRRNWLRGAQGKKRETGGFPEDWAPHGMKVCPNRCSRGYIIQGLNDKESVPCPACNSKGMVPK